MKKLKWITISYYVDGNSGEQITKHKAQTEYYIHEKLIHREKTEYSSWHQKVVGLPNYKGVTTVTNICYRKNQLRLAFD